MKITSGIHGYVDKFIKELDTISEEELKERIVYEHQGKSKKFKGNNQKDLIEYLKSDKSAAPIYTLYLCQSNKSKAKNMLIKLFHIFNINNIDVDKELEYIRVNATEKLVRCSDWKNDSILLYDNLSNQISLKRYYANYKHKNNWGMKPGDRIIK